MSLKSHAPLEEYISPEVQLVEIKIEAHILTGSNEGVGGKDDTDYPW